MLIRLTILNVALIDRAELEFSEGLNILSGETGAGKSVILDSIDFVLGAKADKGMVRSGEPYCLVSAEFSLSEEVKGELRALDIEPEETLILTRKLTADGKSTLKLNGMSVTSSMLRRVTSLLVDVHGQSEHFFLLKESNQLRLVDNLAGERVRPAKERVRALLAEKKELTEGLRRLGGDEGERSRRTDILAYQIKELEEADLKEGEEEELKALRLRYRNLERIRDGLAAARDALLSDGCGADAVNSARRALTSVAKYDARCGEISDRLAELYDRLFDEGSLVEDLLGETEMDEGDAARVEERLDELHSLYKKYGGDYAAATAFLESAREEYDLLVHSAERYAALERELARVNHDLYLACSALTEARKEAAAGFCGRVIAELRTLNIPSARFEVSFDEVSEEDIDRATQEGLGGLRFLFSANAGEPLKELGKIISGGEMSRFMLAVKAQLSAVGGIGTYIFDEIDAGIGGKTAEVVAKKFAGISQNVQLLAVTHLARIASFADREFLIEKREEGGKTFARIREVEGEERIREISRLIGGESEHVTAHARELIAEAERYKASLKS